MDNVWMIVLYDDDGSISIEADAVAYRSEEAAHADLYAIQKYHERVGIYDFAFGVLGFEVH